MEKKIKIPGQVYRVGGAVRDFLMGKESSDEDYVVVGASPEEMLAAGFEQVGADFPVFLHPETKDEYALARMERKQGHGYHGFSVEYGKDVSLADDLIRRDLTINAIAMDEKGNIYDPYNGKQDLKDGVLRHVSEAFSEDPLRILRVARFKARFGFEIAPETMELMRGIHDAGETQHLTKERIWKEASRALTHDNGSEFFVTLQKIGLGIEIFKEMPGFNTDRNIDFFLTRAPLSSVDEMLKGKSLESRVAHWTLPFDRTVDIKAAMEMWREAGAPGEIMDRIGMTGAIWNTLAKSSEKDRTTPSDNWFKMFMELDALRRTDRWIAAYEDVKDHFSIISNKPDFIPDINTVKEWINTLKIDAEAVAKSAPSKKDIKDYVFNARRAAWESLSVKEAEPDLEESPRRLPRMR